MNWKGTRVEFGEVRGKFSRKLNLKSFRPVELNHRQYRDGLRPGSIASG